MIRAYRVLWAARLLKLAARVYPGDIKDIHADLERGIADAEAGLRGVAR